MKVAILIEQPICPFELGCATELFMLPRPDIAQWYQTEIVKLSAKQCDNLYGLQVNAKRIESLMTYDMVVIPGWTSRQQPLDNKTKTAISTFAQYGGRIVSFCSAAFLLAESGVLNHRRATTHWQYAGQFKQRYPQINWANDVLFTQDDNIWCSAGSAAAIDLGLEIIRQDFGARVANKVAKRLVISAHRAGGQAQYVEAPVSKKNDYFAEVMDWAIINLHQGVTVQMMAERAKMTRRSFDRHFRKQTGLSAKHWLINQQLHRAKGLLEVRNSNIEDIAYKTGFKTALSLRQHFKKHLGVCPNQYRQQFRTC